jgi:hypothetical protein
VTVSAAQVRALAALGITGEQLFAVIDVIEMRDERNVTDRDVLRDGPMTSAERSRNYRARKRHEKRDEITVTPLVTPPPSPPSNGFPTPLPITTPSTPTLALAREPSDDGWPKDAGERFWKAYPHKVAKKAALRALAAARRTGVTFERLMFALDRYKLEKPPDRAWCNPATWLNGGRWDDEPANSETSNGQSTFQNRTAQAPRSGATGQDAILAGMGRLADRIRARGDAERREREASDDGGAAAGNDARLI